MLQGRRSSSRLAHRAHPALDSAPRDSTPFATPQPFGGKLVAPLHVLAPVVLGGEPFAEGGASSLSARTTAPDDTSTLPASQQQMRKRPRGWQSKAPVGGRAPPGGSVGASPAPVVAQLPAGLRRSDAAVALGASLTAALCAAAGPPLPPAFASPLPVPAVAAPPATRESQWPGAARLVAVTPSHKVAVGAVAGPPPLQRPARVSRDAERPLPPEAVIRLPQPLRLFRLDSGAMAPPPIGAPPADWVAVAEAAGPGARAEQRLRRQPSGRAMSSGGGGPGSGGSRASALTPEGAKGGRGSPRRMSLGSEGSFNDSSARHPPAPQLQHGIRAAAPAVGLDDGSSVYSGLVDGSIASGTLAVSCLGTGTASMSVAARVVAATAAAALASDAPVAASGGGGSACLLALPAHERLVLIRGHAPPLDDAAVEGAVRSAAALAGGVQLQRARSHYSSPAGPAVAAAEELLSPSRVEGFRRRRSDAIGAEADTLRFSMGAPLPVVSVSMLVPQSVSPAGLSLAASAGSSVAAAVASLDISTLSPGDDFRSPSLSEQLAPAPAARAAAQLAEVADPRSAESAPVASGSPAWNLLLGVGGSGGRRGLPAQPLLRQPSCADDEDGEVALQERCGGSDLDARDPRCLVRKRLPFDDQIDLEGASPSAASAAVSGVVRSSAAVRSWPPAQAHAGQYDPGLSSESMPPPPQPSPHAGHKRLRGGAARSPLLVHSMAPEGWRRSPGPRAPPAAFAAAAPPSAAVAVSPSGSVATPPPRFRLQKRPRRGSLSSGPWSSTSRSGSRAYHDAVAEQSVGASHRGSARSHVESVAVPDLMSFLGSRSGGGGSAGLDGGSGQPSDSTPAESPVSAALSDALLSPSFGEPVGSTPSPAVPAFDVLDVPSTGGACFLGWMPASSPVSLRGPDDSDAADEDDDDDLDGCVDDDDGFEEALSPPDARRTPAF